MELAEVIRSRRSVGVYTDQPVSVDLVRDLLETAVFAPNHRLTEPWRFVMLTGSGRDRYAEIRRDMVLEFMTGQGETERQQAAEGTFRKFANVPMFLAVVMRKQANAELDIEDYAACCCVIQNFLLLAWEHGLGTNWKTYKNHPRMRELLGLADDERVVGVVQVGYSAEAVRPGVRKPAADRLTIVE